MPMIEMILQNHLPQMQRLEPQTTILENKWT